MGNQTEMKSTHEIIYVERIGGTKKVINKICKFDSAEEVQKCIKKLKWIDSRQKLISKRKSHKKQWHETDMIKLEKVFQQVDDGLAFLLILNADIRAGELCALTWSDVDLARGAVNISKTVDNFTNGKSGVKLLRDTRIIQLTEDLVNKLKLYKKGKVTTSNSDYILKDDKILKPSELNLRLKSILEKVGIVEKTSLHDLRKMSNIRRKVEH